MVDDIIIRRRTLRETPVVNYRPSTAAIHARRIVRVSEIGRSRDDLQRLNIDEVFIRISQIESEPSVVAARAEAIKPKLAKKTRGYRGAVLYGLAGIGAMCLIAITGYISLDTWMTNDKVKSVIAADASAKSTSAFGEGEDQSDVPLSAVNSYVVAPDLPRTLTIAKLNIRARVLPMGVNSDNSMQAPANIFDSGWYSGSAKPGAPGAVVIDGHASGATRAGLFAYLDTLVVGDRLAVERGDGQALTYEVVFTDKVDLGAVDMAKLLRPYGTASEGLNLITCIGEWVPDKKTFDHRFIVYAKRV